jgi:RNA polymerase sigma factor (sigma-70 family)
MELENELAQQTDEHTQHAKVLQLHQAIEQLAEVQPRLARVVECRWFAGLTEIETASALGVSDRTVRRDWEKAQLLLQVALS